MRSHFSSHDHICDHKLGGTSTNTSDVIYCNGQDTHIQKINWGSGYIYVKDKTAEAVPSWWNRLYSRHKIPSMTEKLWWIIGNFQFKNTHILAHMEHYIIQWN